MTGPTSALQTPITDDVARESAAVLAMHGRSFSWASKFLPRGARVDASVAYAFCRLVDDVVDEAPNETAARDGLEELVSELDGNQPRPLLRAWQALEGRQGIDRRAATDLIAGVRSDLDLVRVDDDRELVLYAYRVAGTVGLMMTRIIGAHDPSATRHAVDLGIGMQLTNICRDVAEDARLGRVYLPANRLRAVGVTHDQLIAGEYDRAAVCSVVADLLALADRFYASAELGMRFIPARPRLAIWIAARVYRAIGRKVLRVGERALQQRVYVPVPGKLLWTVAALGAFVGLGRIRTRDDVGEMAARQALPL